MMRLISKLAVLLLAVILVITACTNGGSTITTDKGAIIAPIPSQTETPTVEKEIKPQTKLILDLFQKEKEMNLKIAGKEYQGILTQIKLKPFGFYVPEILKVFEFEDGATVGFNKAEFISLIELDRLNNQDNIPESIGTAGDTQFMEEELMHYTEYVGSTKDVNGVRHDAFLLSGEKIPATVIVFRYFEKNKLKVLPAFLEVASHLTYLQVERQ